MSSGENGAGNEGQTKYSKDSAKNATPSLETLFERVTLFDLVSPPFPPRGTALAPAVCVGLRTSSRVPLLLPLFLLLLAPVPANAP